MRQGLLRHGLETHADRFYSVVYGGYLKKRILIDGYNLGLEHGTGIATYARNLIATLKSMGCEVSCLYDRRAKRGNRYRLINEIRFFDSKAPYVTHVDKTLHVIWQAIRATGLVVNFTIPLRPVEVQTNREVLTSEFSGTLPEADRFFSYEQIYHLAYVYFYITGQFLKVKIPDIDIAHWTFALPIEAVGVKNIYTLHDIIPIRLPYTTQDNKRLYDKLLRKIIGRADRLCTVSEFSRRDIIKTYPEAESKLRNSYQCVRLPHKLVSMPDDQVESIVSNSFKLKHRDYFLMVGALEPKKNHARLIDAYLASGIESPLVIVGPDGWCMEQLMGSYDASLHRNVRLQDGLILEDKRVIRLGYVRFSTLVSLIRGAKMMCFPSLYEGFGLPVLEAMALGTPVLTANTSSLPEVAADAAVYVDPYDVNDIREKLIWSDEHMEELDKLSALGRQRASRFSTEAYAMELERLYA